MIELKFCFYLGNQTHDKLVFTKKYDNSKFRTKSWSVNHQGFQSIHLMG